MPPHSSHLLQPLDVSYFAAVKKAYSQGVEDLIRHHTHHVDTVDFLTIYKDVHTQALSSSNIQSGFAATSLIPHDPERVLLKISIQLASTPPPAAVSSGSTSTPVKPPQSIRQLQRELQYINKQQSKLANRQESPLAAISQLINRLAEGLESGLHQTLILKQQVADLSAAQAITTRKRKQAVTYLSQSRHLTVAEGVEMMESATQAASAADQAASSGRKKRASPTCSKCGRPRHTIRTYAQHQNDS